MVLTQAFKEALQEALDRATTLLIYQSPGGQEQLTDLSLLSL